MTEVEDREIGRDSAVVLLSGGMDSAVCLMWAKERWSDITAFSVDYGQKHIVELESAKAIAKLAEVPHIIMKCPDLTGGAKSVTTWLPGRNLVLLALAATLQPKNLVIGVCQNDEADYPDCRERFVRLARRTISASMGGPTVGLEAPLLHLSKAKTLELATKIPLAWEAIGLSMTCYLGTRCGTCPACLGRAAGFAEAGKTDPAA